MQLLPREFYGLTWGQYNVRVRGWLRQEEEKWEHTRLLYGLLYNVNVEQKHRQPMEKLVPLRKDRKRLLLKASATPQVSREELIARIKQRDNLT